MIGDLYNAKNVVIGQAACLLAPAYTPMPAMGLFSLADPFSIAPWPRGKVLGLVAPVTGYTLTYTTSLGNAQTTTSLPVASTAATVQAALQALSNVGAGGAYVSGAAPTLNIGFSQKTQPGTLTVTGTGGVPTVVNNLWVPNGATDQGWKYVFNKTTTNISIEEQSATVGTELDKQTISVEAALSEDIENTLGLVFNMQANYVAPATGVPGYTDLQLTDLVLRYALALLMVTKDGYPRILYIPDVTSLSNASTSLRRSSAKRMYPAVFTSEAATSDIHIYNITAPGL